MNFKKYGLQDIEKEMPLEEVLDMRYMPSRLVYESIVGKIQSDQAHQDPYVLIMDSKDISKLKRQLRQN